MPSQREIETLNRILAINWRVVDETRQRSQLRLFEEYLRRSALWSYALEWQDAHPIISDFPARLVEGVLAAPVNTTLMQQTLRTLGKTSVYERMLLTRVLNWAAIAERESVLAYGLPDLYEPIIVFYERGGWISKGGQEGEWEVSGVYDILQRSPAYIDLPEYALDAHALDALDARADDGMV